VAQGVGPEFKPQYHKGKRKKQQMLARMLGKRNRVHCWWECKLVQPLWKAVWRLVRKLKGTAI
jgi:hypothetical protein